MQLGENLANMTQIVLYVIIIIIAAAAGIGWYIFKIRPQQAPRSSGSSDKNKTSAEKEMPKENLKNFLPLDDIQDDMIIQEKGEKFTMLIQCDGINYYLMSDEEKISVEEGFIQFLNSLRFPVQLYIQTRTVNLDDSIKSYTDRYDVMKSEFDRMLANFQALDRKGASDKELLELGAQLEKKENVLEYAQDLINNIQYITQNKDVLEKKYFIAVSYHISEMGVINKFSPQEIHDISHNELLNRANSISSAITVCGIDSHVLTTDDLVETLYVAINRDDADIFNIRKVLESGLQAITSTAKDPLIKREELKQTPSDSIF